MSKKHRWQSLLRIAARTVSDKVKICSGVPRWRWKPPWDGDKPPVVRRNASSRSSITSESTFRSVWSIPRPRKLSWQPGSLFLPL